MCTPAIDRPSTMRAVGAKRACATAGRQSIARARSASTPDRDRGFTRPTLCPGRRRAQGRRRGKDRDRLPCTNAHRATTRRRACPGGVPWTPPPLSAGSRSPPLSAGRAAGPTPSRRHRGRRRRRSSAAAAATPTAGRGERGAHRAQVSDAVVARRAEQGDVGERRGDREDDDGETDRHGTTPPPPPARAGHRRPPARRWPPVRATRTAVAAGAGARSVRSVSPPLEEPVIRR